MTEKKTKTKLADAPKLMQIRLTPEQVDKAITAYARQLFVGQWNTKVIHMHKTGGVTIEAEYMGLSANIKAVGVPREPVLEEALNKAEQAEAALGSLMEGADQEMVEL